MISRIDLHLHTTASDGVFSPQEIVTKASGLRLETIAITDHDILDGIGPAITAAEVFPGLTIIPGVEISTDIKQGDVHVLGYFIDYNSPELKSALAKMRQARLERARGIIDRLARLGIHIKWSRVQEIAGDGSVGRPHIALAMLEKGNIAYIGEAFEKYISRDGPAYVERIKMSPEEAVKLILKSGGLPVLAHPLTIPEPEKLIERLTTVGLIGIEVYYNNFTAEQVDRLANLARRHNLIATGGSDYHGLDDASETMIGGVEVPTEAVRQLIALKDKGKLNTIDSTPRRQR